ncbi:MAG: TPM domain-containing protein [Bacteroidia bacterium]|nr:TPM domain-containing protein [Bacteroidia bacterium]
MANTFFTEAQQQQIVEAIRLAELNTSGEIRVHIEAKCAGDAYERAKHVFGELGMHATELKNGVLFYLAYADKKFAILGDKGIHEKVSQKFWDEENTLLLSHFKQQKFAEGLCLAIEQAGEKLKHHFAYQSDDVNELSNEISFGNNGGSNA